MRFAKVQRTDNGYFLDPRAYVDHLPTIRNLLPPGASSFATDPSHFDFSSVRCVKDLRFLGISLVDSGGQLSLEIRFAPNRFKHDAGLSIHYSDVTGISIEAPPASRPVDVWPETRRLGDVQLDEILPHDSGCSHEIVMTGGSITVVSADLMAKWDDETDGDSAAQGTANSESEA